MSLPESSADTTDWRFMCSRFQSRQLTVPPVPQPLRHRLAKLGGWHWGTRADDPMSLYMLDSGLVKELLAGDLSEQVQVVHSGHGINSYALTYCLGYRGIALVTQLAWGGVYQDRTAAAARLNRMFDRCAALVERVEALGREHHTGPRLVCLSSDIRGRALCGWIAVPQPGDATPLEFLRSYPVEVDTALEVAGQVIADRPVP
ncbi:hypothetical protein [Plantactinospora sonchi]|uniref:Uncharacterized protein n=1 Tax=Plantactinospora sonchi TaxID=1544735 RepID=A0ABU7RPY4_9ACTN